MCDKLIIAYLAMGAQTTLQDKKSLDLDAVGYQGELAFIEAAIAPSEYIEYVAEYVADEGIDQGVFLYDVVESFGQQHAQNLLQGTAETSALYYLLLLEDLMGAEGYDGEQIRAAAGYAHDKVMSLSLVE